MPIYTPESLDQLRHRVDLVEVLQGYLELQRGGAAYKALCPFHDEKSPSFTVGSGSRHYHCFGCGAHGDAVSFLMDYCKMSFSDAIESLAQRFGVTLEVQEGKGDSKVNRTKLKEANDHACSLFQCFLLESQEGQAALHYLQKRGMSLDFIKHFRLGWAPRDGMMFRRLMHEARYSDALMVEAGLIRETRTGAKRAFFEERILFPVQDAVGGIIGFSGRKIREEVFGGKYINTSETPLFRKSRVLYGLNHCRRRIAKERRAVIVEGQVDALRLIFEGLNLVVAGQGTAFGAEHVGELVRLGVGVVYLAMDGDTAGQEAALKIGHLFQKQSIEVLIVPMPQGKDPDTVLQEKGIEGVVERLEKSEDYLSFLVARESEHVNLQSPAAKSRLIGHLATRIREWGDAVMVHESLRRLAALMNVPESSVGVGQELLPNIHIRRQETVGVVELDPEELLECDVLRWLFAVAGQREELVTLMLKHLQEGHFLNPGCRALFQVFCSASEESRRDLLGLATQVGEPLVQEALERVFRRPVNLEKAETAVRELLQRILERDWMRRLEGIREKIQGGNCSDDEAMELLSTFNKVQKSRPQVEF